jgi:uncharacterized membrane protein
MLLVVAAPWELVLAPETITIPSLAASIIGVIAILGLYAVAPPVYAAGVGVAIAAVLTRDPSLLQSSVVAISGLLVLVKDATDVRRPSVGAVAILSAGIVVLAAAALAVLFLPDLWAAALALLALGATLVYGVHRYERVRMGLVSDT